MNLLRGPLFPYVCFLVAFALMAVGELLNRRFGISWLPLVLMFWTLSALPFAITFYRMRRLHRLMYGIFEMITACALFYVTMLGIINHHISGPMSFEQIGTRTITFIVLIYFMVRALDNIGEGLKVGSKWAQRWDAIFPKS